VSANALTLTHGTENIPSNELIVSFDVRGRAAVINGLSGTAPRDHESVASTASAVARLARRLDATVIPLLSPVDPRTGTMQIPAPGGAPLEPGAHTVTIAPDGPTRTVVVPAELGRTRRAPHTARGRIGEGGSLYVATPEVLRAFHIDPDAIAPDTDVVAYQGAPHQILTLAPAGSRAARGVVARSVVVQTMKVPKDFGEPRAFVTTHGMRRLGLSSTPYGWVVRARHPIDDAHVGLADQVAAKTGTSIESHHAQPSYDRIRNGATTAGILVALGVLAMTVGLIRSETARDLRTLTAAGATSTARRTLTGATAGTLALLGALLGTATAYLALIAWHRSDLHELSRVPYANLVTIVVVLPMLAFVAGWLLAGREPQTIGRRPIE
jgi:putative ABC transport system permease protein